MGIKTSTLEDKRTAAEMLCIYARQLEGAFAPYVQQVCLMELAYTSPCCSWVAVSFIFCDGVPSDALFLLQVLPISIKLFKFYFEDGRSLRIFMHSLSLSLSLSIYIYIYMFIFFMVGSPVLLLSNFYSFFNYFSLILLCRVSHSLFCPGVRKYSTALMPYLIGALADSASFGKPAAVSVWLSTIANPLLEVCVPMLFSPL